MAWQLSHLRSIDRIRLIDGDQVALSNLPRQSWYNESDIGKNKAMVLAREIGSSMETVAVPEMITGANVQDLLGSADIVFDGTDHWAPRLLIQDWAYTTEKPWIYGSALRWDGMTALFLPKVACLHCLFGSRLQEGPRCFEAGVTGSTTLAVAGQAVHLFEDWVAGRERDLSALWLIDGFSGTIRPVWYGHKGCGHYGTG